MSSSEKCHPVFICSTGRTGTQFLAEGMAAMIPESTAYHEPGVLWITRPLDVLRKLLKFGPYHITFGQLDIRRSMYVLSNRRAAGKIDDATALKYLKGMREKLIAENKGKIYIESSGHLFGILDLIPKVFPNAKIIFIVRDPRSWIASALRTFEYILYGPIDQGISLRAKDIITDPYGLYWDDMSKFEKYCWWYEFINSYVLSRCKDLENFRVYRFEDLFSSEKKDEYFCSMLEFASTFDDGFSRSYSYRPDILKKPKHSQKDKKSYFPWRMWRFPRVQMLLKHCRQYMEDFGYGSEPVWQKKVRMMNVWEAKKRKGGIRFFYRLSQNQP